MAAVDEEVRSGAAAIVGGVNGLPRVMIALLLEPYTGTREKPGSRMREEMEMYWHAYC